jgi:hypothetical protein
MRNESQREDLATPQERRARFRLIHGGRAVMLAPFVWLAGRARDHAAVAVAGSTVAVVWAITTGLLVSADGIERQTDPVRRPVELQRPFDSTVPTPTVTPLVPGAPKPQPASTDAAATKRAATPKAVSLNTPRQDASPSSTPLLPHFPKLQPRLDLQPRLLEVELAQNSVHHLVRDFPVASHSQQRLALRRQYKLQHLLVGE